MTQFHKIEPFHTMTNQSTNVMINHLYPKCSRSELLVNPKLLQLHFLAVVIYDKIERVQQVYEYGIDLSVKDEVGTTLGDSAFIQRVQLFHYNKGSKEVLDFLIEKGVDINKGVNVDSVSAKPESTALIVASNYGIKEAVHYLLEKGADPDIKNQFGQNALSVLCTDEPEIAEMLITPSTDFKAIGLYGKNMITEFRRQNFSKTLSVINALGM